MSRLPVVLAAALALVGCSKKDEVVVAAPVAPAHPPSPAEGSAPPPAPPGSPQGAELPAGHPPLEGMGADGGAAPGQDAGMGMQAAPPHGAAMSAGGDVGDVKVPRATGKDARTIAEIYAQRQALKDKAVTVRGKVVKFTPGVMGKNWIHLRDGTGTPGKDNDVTVTSQDSAAKGDVVVIQGTVAVDQNIGMGAPYPVVIQDAKVTK